MLLTANFDSVYPTNLVVGSGNLLTFTDAPSVFAYLPATGASGVLTSSIQNPLSTSSGNLGGEVTALKLNIDFSTLLSNTVSLGSLRICNLSSLTSLNGQTVSQFLSTANQILGGVSTAFSPTATASLAQLINTAFVGGAPSTFAQSSLVAGSCPTPWQTGDVVTRTQAVWDATTSWFSAYSSTYASTSGIVEVGIPGTAGFSMRFTSAGAVTNYFVQTGPVGALTADLINPTTSSSGAFGGQVLALRMNVDFSAAGAIGGTEVFGSLRICAMADTSLNNRTVAEVLGLANTLLGGGSNGYTIPAITDLVTSLNNAFVAGVPSTFAVAHLLNGSCP